MIENASSLPFGKIIVVSLKSSEDRRKYVRNHLLERGLPKFEFFDAIGPKDPKVDNAYSSKIVFEFPPCFRCGQINCSCKNNFLIPAQVATFLTYLSLWKKVSLEKCPVLICEDDVVIHPWWDDVMRMIMNRTNKGELNLNYQNPLLIRLGWAVNEEHSQKQELTLNREVRMSNPCHIITPAFAKDLLDEFKIIDTTADIYLHQSSNSSKLHGWTVHPPAATELSWSYGKFESLIHPKEIHRKYLKNKGSEKEASEYQIKISNHLDYLFYRRFLIVGHPRCGTGFTANLMCQLGLDIGHESDGKDGLSTWCFGSEGEAPYWKDPIARRRKSLKWSKLIMPIRDINNAVPSIMRDNIFSPKSYEYRRFWIKKYGGFDLNSLKDNFQRAVYSFLQWNKFVESMNPDLVFRIEYDTKLLYDFISSNSELNLPALNSLDLSPVNTNKKYMGSVRRKPFILESDWSNLPEKIWKEVLNFCEKHNYKNPLQKNSKFKEIKTPNVNLNSLEDLFLKPSGWSRSLAEGKPVKADGSVIPWYTFSAIEFLERVAKYSDSVFEYGIGHSTLWWQERVQIVRGVDHDIEWINKLKPEIKDNVNIQCVLRNESKENFSSKIIDSYYMRMRRTKWSKYTPERIIIRGLEDQGFEQYASAILKFEDLFDFIIIDGMARRLCCEFAIHKIKDDGIIILDNSNRSDYDSAFDILESNGFYQIPFWGLVPGANFMTCTSVFIKNINRLPGAFHKNNSHQLKEY